METRFQNIEKDGKIMKFLDSIELEATGFSPSCPINRRVCPYGDELINRLKCDFIKEQLSKKIISRSPSPFSYYT